MVSKKRVLVYIETIDGDSWTGTWLRNNFEEGSVPTFVRGHPNPKHLWHLTAEQFRILDRNHFSQNLKYRVYTGLPGERPHRNYDLEKSAKQRLADAVGKELRKHKAVKSKIGRGTLALAK